MTQQEAQHKMNEWGHNRVPFLFLIDFECHKPLVLRLDEVNPQEVLFSFNDFSNASIHHSDTHVALSIDETKSFASYEKKFNQVMGHLERGDTFLTNLTERTKVKINGSLRDCFFATHARYRMWMRHKFVFFSPEIFVRIRDGKIFSFPMKGTIDARLPHAKAQLLNDEKEIAEHVTIVDLLRNDISRVATNVQVKRFRYVEEIKTATGALLQVSSEIEGQLEPDFATRLGDIIFNLLPAGSISGAPKDKTVKIIAATEKEERGYYTGVAGYFDGNSLDSGVVIRYIEQQGQDFYYRSGGGITTQSEPKKEFNEMLSKIYVPVS